MERRGGPEPASTGEESSWYMPEPVYMRATPGFPVDAAARATARCVAARASRYWARVYPSERSGTLPPEEGARRALIDDLFDWRLIAPRAKDYPPLLELILYRDEEKVLDMHDGFPSEVAVQLTPGQFASLQECLAEAGLPPDLFFPRSALREVVEPAEWWGGVVLTRCFYSPLGWQRRQEQGPPALRIPTEAERLQSLDAALGRIIPVVKAHLAALGAEVPTGDAGAAAEVRELLRQVRRVRGRCKRSLASHGVQPETRMRPDPRLGPEHGPALLTSYRRFFQSLDLRLMELREPGTQIDPKELREIETLMSLVHRVMVRLRGLA